MFEFADTAQEVHSWLCDLLPYRRSLTGPGVRKTLAYLGELMPGLCIQEIPTGSPVLDWQIPREWIIRDAYIEDMAGNRLVALENSDLHVVGYSNPVNAILTRGELDTRLHSIPEMPDAIPYVTSYYSTTWGICLTENQRKGLGDGPFRVVIDSDLRDGSLTLADLVIPGASDREVLFSTYICHPSMANNELSGPVVAAALARMLLRRPSLRYTYRFVFAPETIGALTYIDLHGEHLKQHVDAGWVLTCLGDERTYSFVPSRMGTTLADRITDQVTIDLGLKVDRYTFLDRGSDERQWCAPLLNLPVCSIMRSKYGTFPEYHTSLDDTNLVTPAGLAGSLRLLGRCVEMLETRNRWIATVIGEPQLGRRGLYASLSRVGSSAPARVLLDVLAYCDGLHDVDELASLTRQPRDVVDEAIAILAAHNLVRRIA